MEPSEETFVYDPPDLPLQIVHADESILLVDKPAGLLSVPGRGSERADCLIVRLRAEFPDVLLVHRLDLDTSGIMVFARSKAAQGALGRQFEARNTKKIYLARLEGEVAGTEGTVDLPLIVDWPNRPRQHVDPVNGRPAVTDWRVIRTGNGETRMRLMPRTGRSHQLRVHMMELGHPILGDPLYAQGAARNHPRLMLHAQSLRFRHPDSGVMLGFSAPCPF